MEAFDLSAFAQGLGWTEAGVSSPTVSDATARLFDLWCEKFKGPQMEYLSRRRTERVKPHVYFPQVQSVLCFGLFYFPGWAEGDLKISNYAWSEDYHSVLKKKLTETAHALQKEIGPFRYRICTDTSPILEKAFAVSAGLGWQGKNTLLLNRNYGSFFFLGEMLTDIPLERFQVQLPSKDYCGQCQRCVEACPTEALEPYILHADRCISYWNLEHKGEFNETTPQDFEGWVAGCDICQQVCPWNQKLIPTPLDEKTRSFQKISAERIRSSDWADEIRDRAISYVPLKNWNRNLEHIENAKRANASTLPSALPSSEAKEHSSQNWGDSSVREPSFVSAKAPLGNPSEFAGARKVDE